MNAADAAGATAVPALDERGLLLTKEELQCLVALLPDEEGPALADALSLQYHDASQVDEAAFFSLVERDLIRVQGDTVGASGPGSSILAAMTTSDRRLDWGMGGGALPTFTKTFFHPIMSVVVTLKDRGARFVQAVKPDASASTLCDAWIRGYEQYAGDETELQITAIATTPQRVRTVNAVRADGVWEAAKAEGGNQLELTDVRDRAGLLDLISEFLG